MMNKRKVNGTFYTNIVELRNLIRFLSTIKQEIRSILDIIKYANQKRNIPIVNILDIKDFD